MCSNEQKATCFTDMQKQLLVDSPSIAMQLAISGSVGQEVPAIMHRALADIYAAYFMLKNEKIDAMPDFSQYSLK